MKASRSTLEPCLSAAASLGVAHWWVSWDELRFHCWRGAHAHRGHAGQGERRAWKGVEGGSCGEIAHLEEDGRPQYDEEGVEGLPHRLAAGVPATWRGWCDT